jgi:uncharacterized membrane protein
MELQRRLVIACFAALALLLIAVEMWLAPLRPGGSLLVLKAAPLLIALPSLWRGQVRTYQWWSMLILAYLCLGLVRGVSDTGASALFGWLEALLAATAFLAVIGYVRSERTTR